MRREDMLAMLNNKIKSLKAKKQAAYDKGAFELWEIFDNQINDIQMTIEGFNSYDRNELKKEILSSLPNLAFYVRKASIHQAITNSIDTALDHLKRHKIN